MEDARDKLDQGSLVWILFCEPKCQLEDPVFERRVFRAGCSSNQHPLEEDNRKMSERSEPPRQIQTNHGYIHQGNVPSHNGPKDDGIPVHNVIVNRRTVDALWRTEGWHSEIDAQVDSPATDCECRIRHG